MKKIKWATHKSLFGQIATSACLLGGSAGLIFGISAGTFQVAYLNLGDGPARLAAATATTNCYSQNINSRWNMYEQKDITGKTVIPGYAQPTSPDITQGEGKDWWEDLHGTSEQGFWRLDQGYNNIVPSQMELEKTPDKDDPSKEAKAMRRKYGSLVIDGATHTALDRSFNQSLYNGIANFNTNFHHDATKDGEALVYKPSQDSTQEFVNIYREAVKNSRILCLAGFNHVTPLNALGKRNGAKINFGSDNFIKNAGMLLIDGDISNNQNVASVLFRSDQPAFLTGVATCMYFLNNLDQYHENYRDLAVAAYGGTAIPTVTVYMGGYQRGIEFYNYFILWRKILRTDFVDNFAMKPQGTAASGYLAKIIESSKYKDEIEAARPMAKADAEAWAEKLYDEYSVKMIKLGGFNTHFSGSFAAGDAIGISKQLLNRGASAIIAVAGPQSLDTAQEVMNQKKNCIVIGVDSAMENSDYQKPFTNPQFKDKTVARDNTVSAQASNIIKFSAVKDMNSVSEKILRLAAQGKNWDTTNDKPWKTASSIPSWNPETEEYPFDRLAVVYDDTNEKYDVIGFLGTQLVKNIPVLNIPAHVQKDGKTYYLNAIRQPTAEEISQEKVKHTFNAANLSDVITLKISAGDTNDQVTFADGAFDFSDAIGKQMNTGFVNIDLSELDARNIKTTADSAIPFKSLTIDKTSRNWKRGIIKFNPKATNSQGKTAYEKLFPSACTTEQNWAIVEADPYKSICTFGFKTCGNIENGLISISWDGWTFLVEALNLLTYVDSESDPDIGVAVPFISLWKAAAEQYQTELEEAERQSEPAYQFVVNQQNATIETMATFDRSSDYYKYYSHTMAILGRFLNRALLPFPKEMTVLLDKSGKPQAATSDSKITILEWLKNNMYFTV